jgi:hypothetical protein
MTLINWFLKFKMHVNTYFCCMKISYKLKRLNRIHENKIFFCFSVYIFFAVFQRKPDILILDLYLYSIKI